MENILLPIDLSHPEKTEEIFKEAKKYKEGREVGFTIAHIVSHIPGVVRAQLPDDSLESFPSQRQSVKERLNSTPGSHLVLVRYSSSHNYDQEWVYNQSDIDGAKIVWAREMSPEEDAELLEYFSDRRVWLLEPGVSPQPLRPYVRRRSLD